MILRGMISRQGRVGGQKVQEAIQLQTQRHGGNQETHTDDKCEITRHQFLLTGV